MRTPITLALLSLFAVACRPAARPGVRPIADARPTIAPRPRGPASITPHNEMVPFGPYGTGSAECTVMLYQWDPQHPGCKYQLNHCARDERSGQVSCLSVADERTVACGFTGDACGASVRCDCPTGSAPLVPDPPGTVVIAPAADGGAWTSGPQCSARVARLAGSGAPDEPCEVSVHDCEGGECHDRWVTVSCGGRTSVCDRPVRCECASPDAAAR
jgi:hypothetical protein